MPIDPRKRLNKTKAVNDHLVRYGSISKGIAVSKYDCYSLTQIISVLRKRYRKQGGDIVFLKMLNKWRLIERE